MNTTDQSLLEFLIISQCRIREHYQLKLQECLAVLAEDQLWQPLEGSANGTVGGLIRHIMEHPRRHAVWMRTRTKPQKTFFHRRLSRQHKCAVRSMTSSKHGISPWRVLLMTCARAVPYRRADQASERPII